jgi:hypothetical protein
MGTTGIADIHGGATRLYPNPASEELYVLLAKAYPNLHVAVYNAIGQQVRYFDLKQTAECTLQVHDLSAGVYFLKFDTQDESFTARFTKQ